jgi:hypothetical protein
MLHRIVGLAAVAALTTASNALPSHSKLQPVQLLIWAKRSGTISGAAMTVSVDGQHRGEVSNLDEQMLRLLGDFEPGLHSYSLGGIRLFRVDHEGRVERIPAPDGSCAGQFVVQPFQTYYFLMVTSPDGTTFQCQIQ